MISSRTSPAPAALALMLTIVAGCRLGPGDCRDDRDCAETEGCVPPYAPGGCGACFVPMNPCTGDADCDALGPGLICAPIGCACTAGDLDCVPGCTNDDQCLIGTRCGADGRCEPLPCATAADCPAQFDCATTCGRRPCTADGACDAGGYCVGGFCHDGPGSCQGPVP